MEAGQMQLSLLFLLIVSICFFQGCSAREPQESYDIISNLTLQWRKSILHASWTLLNPSGHLGYYSVTWDDGVQTRSKTQTMQELTMGSTFPCFHVLNVTVAPHNETAWEIGEPASRSYIWQDVLTNITLKNDGNITQALWSLKCRSNAYLKFKLTCHENGQSLTTLRTSYDSASRGQTKFSGLCLNESASLCTGFYVTIQRTNGVPSSNGVSASGLYSSFELHFELMSPVSIKLTWPSPSRRCAIARYIVHYSGTQLWGDRSTHTDSFQIDEYVDTISDMNEKDGHVSDRKEIVVANLWPYSHYVVSVTAERSGNDNLKSIVTLQTAESKPSAPSSITTTTNSSSVVVKWSEPTRMNGKLVNYIIRWYKDSKLVEAQNSSKQSYTMVNLEPCVNYNITISAITGGGEGDAAQTSGMMENGCTRRTLSTTIPTVTSNSDSSNGPHATKSPSPLPITEPSSPPDMTRRTVLAAVSCCLVVIFVFTFLIVRRRCRIERRKTGDSSSLSHKGFCNRLDKICCNSKQRADQDQDQRADRPPPIAPHQLYSTIEQQRADQDQDQQADRPPPIYGEMASVPEQNNFEMRTFNGTEPSDADAFVDNTYGQYYDRSRVINTTTGQGVADEASPLGILDNGQVINEVNSVGSSNIRNAENIGRTQKHKLLEALSLLESIRGNDDRSISHEKSTSSTTQSLIQQNESVGYTVYSEVHEERLSEAMRLINEFMAAGGNYTELMEIAGRPPSMTESLGEHTYYYPRLTESDLKSILADAKRKRKNQRKR